MPRYILGIDQSTSGTTASLIDERANVVGSTYVEVPVYVPRPGWVEQDPVEIWTATQRAMSIVLQDARAAAADIEAIGIANQRETTILWNRRTGVPVGRAIVWQDRRTLEICQGLADEDGPAIEDRTGMVIVPNCAASKLRWLIENDQSVQRGLAVGELVFGTVDSWLIWNLSGGVTHVTDHSNASVTLLQDARTLAYDDAILDALGIPRDILPDLRSSSEYYAETLPECFFGSSVPISGCAGDQQAAMLGQGCVSAGMAKTTFGAGSFMVLNVGGRYIPPVSGVFSPVLWVIDGAVNYGLEGMADVSGAALRWLRDGLGIISETAEADALAQSVPDTGGVYFVPAFVGLGAPHFDAEARGTMVGLTQFTTRHHIARAALEAMAYQTRDAFEALKGEVKISPDVLRADGGGARSDFLLQFQADILGIPVERPAQIETTAIGAAFLAGIGVGYWDSVDDVAATWLPERRFEPQCSEDEREQRYAGWLEALGRAAGPHARMPAVSGR